jgi:nicotinamide-nucleotide amidase
MISNDELQELAIKIGQLLTDTKKSVSTAESCTGGWVGKEFTGIPGSSNWYGFGFITYSNKAKLKTLGVTKDALTEEGAVSERVVKEMAEGAIKNSGSDFSISISGIAGPSGGSEDKPVGTVCFGIGSKDNISCYTKHFEGNRDQVRKKSVAFALKELLKCLQ